MAGQVQRTQIQDDATHRHTERLRQQSNELADVPILQGRAITRELPNGSTVSLNHGLSRPATGFILIGLKNASSAGYIRTVRITSRVIELQANGYGGSIEATLWVF